MSEGEKTLLIEVTPELMAEMFTRDHEGNRLVVELGKPAATAWLSNRPGRRNVYVPTVTVDTTDNPWRKTE